ncbi:CDP-glucose 4,6-dehydratase [Synechococcus sp. A15-127]|uniref:CDP-glucose 4,6-dehydratase n=1 Tax=Synechococcus sp. A15-127 TaxID=1050624 RepID=UPI001CA3E936|nr:CDP-glucose 4,6-dehydratase [Synechococcus sp. A15-127]
MELIRQALDPSFWQGKRVLLTGHSGFKGSWLVLWLSRLGAEVTGISLRPNTSPNLYNAASLHDFCDSNFFDILDFNRLDALVKKSQPQIVFHFAAQPLVRESYVNPLGTFNVNIMGTAHVLESIRYLDDLHAAVMITTDKVYRNNECMRPYSENDVLGGHDPYSASKAAAEILISSYRDSFFAETGVGIATARAGNVIGGGDWSANRLIPDAVRAWQSGQPLFIRNPNAIRPWQHVLEPLAGYLSLAFVLACRKSSSDIDMYSSFNFGPPTDMPAATVKDAIILAQKAYGEGVVNYGSNIDGPHEAGTLILDSSKAQSFLGIKAIWSLADSINHTMNWYHSFYSGEDARALCQADIDEYEAIL